VGDGPIGEVLLIKDNENTEKWGYTLSGIRTHDPSVRVTVCASDYMATAYLNSSVKDENCLKTAVRKRPRSAIAAKLDTS
jgi:hypothetical protein